MSQNVKLYHNGIEKIKTNRPFDGVIVQTQVFLDSGVAMSAGDIGKQIAPNKVICTLRNLTTKKVPIQMTLAQLWAVMNKGENKLKETLIDGGHLAVDSDGLTGGYSQDYSLPLPVYHGDYEWTFEVKDCFDALTRANSFVSIELNPTTEPMLFETHIRDISVDKVKETADFNGASDIIVIKRDDLTQGTATQHDAFRNSVSRVMYTSAEQNDARDLIGALGYHNSFCENPPVFGFGMLILHSGHVLTNGNIEIENDLAVAKDLIIIEKVKTDLADLSESLMEGQQVRTSQRMPK